VKSSALPEFWDCLEALPPPIQKIARKNFKLWQTNPSLKSLGFKKIKSDLWSVRAGSGYRALATFEDDRYLWFWIGPHDEYERLLRDL
jgi:hypothetical protein